MLRQGRWLSVVGLAITVLAACGGDEPDAGSSEARVEIIGTDGLEFEPAELTVAAGEVTIDLTSEQEVEHTVTIEELGDVEVVAADGGETATGTIELEPGTYTFYCSVPGHRAAGMEGVLTVE